jgi:guanosine-3',5'-bis(diphosphate) 3'-pyrophosphohydrolase
MVRRFEDILERVREYAPETDMGPLRRAYVFSAREHRDQVRHSGEPYLIHPLEVAYILADLRLDTSSIVAGLLHDVVEDTLTTIETVAEYFGDDVSHIVAGVTKISKLQFASPEQAEAENLRRMILAVVDDIRVVMVKLADRLHNMRTLGWLPLEKRERIARETRDIYAPIANRLGIGRIKSELEELVFEHLEPAAFKQVSLAINSRRKGSAKFIDEIRETLTGALAEAGITAEISGRTKTIYSIYRKMKAQRIGIDEVYDYVAFRIVTDSVKDCYGVLGIVHSIWRPVPGRIKDYIAMPKLNMYQSLHTSVMTDKGHPFEIQLRTEDMHRIAEEGIAAHWQYKEGGQLSDQDAAKVNWLRQILEWQHETKDPREFMEMVRIDLFPDEVYTFTPKGKVLSFPNGATPIDFAYAIHSEVGAHIVGAKVNGRIVPLKYELKNGDIVEILTQPGRHPSRDWLAIATTSRARSKIRAWLRTNERTSSVAIGKELTEKEFRKYKLNLKRFEGGEELAKALQKLGLSDLDDFFSQVCYGKLTPRGLISRLVPEDHIKEKTPAGIVARTVKRALGRGERGIKVLGMDDIMISLAKCCNPVRGERIVGYISRGKGVSVHALQCPNVVQLMYEADRRIEVEWGGELDGTSLFDIKLILDVEDRQGLLAQIISAIAEEKSNIRDVNAQTHDSPDAKISFVLGVTDRKHMDRVVSRLRRINGVRDVERVLR